MPDFVKAFKKPFLWMLPWVRRKNKGDKDPGLPEVNISHHEEEIPEAWSHIPLTDADAEADPGPRSDRVPEVQEKTSDEKRSDHMLDLNEFNSAPTKEALHKLCNKYAGFSKEERWDIADAIASNHLDLMLDHYLESQETACSDLMHGVFAEGSCSLNTCLNHFIVKLNEGQITESKELPLAKVRALRGIKAIVQDFCNIQDLKDWLSFHLVTLANVLVSQFQREEKGTSRKPKMYLVPGEAIDILSILLQKLDLVQNMLSSL
ncbi:uncharacterized protein LOC121929520 [Sceloporus undulatus]|uniref:uncharacterized protein LOC121929520 n=1 Tax=Sceloporus undulatus TaxID=8520 RepID=UPI001C4A78F1|nr:uncharacterized protein LOC121929520 [Sceloporus undulatus]